MLTLTVILISCSSVEKIGEKKVEQSDDEYIFDEVPDSDVLKFESPKEVPSTVYAIQVGAFSTKQRADAFAEKSKYFFNLEFEVSFNDKVNMFVVRLSEVYTSRINAEGVRNEFWKFEDYDDAWIVEINELK